MKIIGLFPLTGNGGIASWAKKFITTFPNEHYKFLLVNVSQKETKNANHKNVLYRIFGGLEALFRIFFEIKKLLHNVKFDILHATTSGDIGSFRDYMVSNLCHRYGVKTILHCHYGCISENVSSRGIIGFFTRKAMNAYDQIWVLDSRSYNALKSIRNLKDKVYLTPNSIDVIYPVDVKPKEYKTIAFCGNLIPSKGIYELVEAAKKTDVILHIVGPGTTVVNEHIKKLSGNLLNKTIFLHGRLPNQEAVNFLKSVDIIALPTYYQSEAFPISILEAMSLSKLVISCPRAAIPDMLTGIDGKPCGILVKPRSSESIVEAITWCQQHKTESDEMCKRAYDKVYNCYRKEIVYDIYKKNYNKLVLSHNNKIS